jgi:branched-subunit amino acid ABC-type transport system permease component
MFSEDTILLFYEITDVIIAGLSTGSVYALMAVGMTLVYGVTKAFNFAYGDFFNMGGYFAWILMFRNRLTIRWLPGGAGHCAAADVRCRLWVGKTLDSALKEAR